MSFRLFAAPEREPSTLTGFSGNRLDRLSEKRDDESATRALADPAARLMLMAEGRLALHMGDRLDPWFSRNEAEALGAMMEAAVLLGFDAAGPVLSVPLGRASEDLPAGLKAIDYRSIYTQGLLDPEALGVLAEGAALLGWHASHRFCGRCGHETRSSAGGFRRKCPNCKAEHFPRTDPVAIMLTIHGEQCLLGRGPHFRAGMYSCLAGFIEPGETIENAVRRETFEEAGIRLGRVVYHASQPWPFPYSLMIGAYGEALDGEVRFDKAELEDCRWFGREEVLSMLAETHPDGLSIPPRGAIASLLIRTWAES